MVGYRMPLPTGLSNSICLNVFVASRGEEMSSPGQTAFSRHHRRRSRAEPTHVTQQEAFGLTSGNQSKRFLLYGLGWTHSPLSREGRVL